MKTLFASFFVVVMTLVGNAQNGTIRGTVYDDATGETVIGANIEVVGSDNGAASDLDGNYNLSIPAGTYALEFSGISFATQTITDVVVSASEVTVVDLRMKTSSQALEGFTITAEAARNTDAALLTIQRKSANLLDGISSQMFSRSGDGDAAAALKRVTGVSVEGGKHIYVRGLGDRYTKTTLNGMEIPGLDPDRNTVQMDIFPTSLIDNILVYKTFTPDLSGDFTGGMVDIITKNFPERKAFNVSGSWGFNPAMNLNENFLSYKGGSLDFLGIDDGTRALPINHAQYVPDNTEGNTLLNDLTSRFSPELAAIATGSGINQSYGLNFGNQINNDKVTWGYNAIANYANNYEFYPTAKYDFYFKDSESAINELEAQKSTKATTGTQSTIWSGLVSGAMKMDNHRLGAVFFHSQNGEKVASKQVQRDFESIGQTLIKDVLTFSQRSVSNFGLNGKHNFNKLSLEWKNAFTYSNISDPDFRVTSLFLDQETGDTILDQNAGSITRFYRNLNEINENFKVDATYELPEMNGQAGKVKMGLFNSYKTRDFSIYDYAFRRRNEPSVGNPNWYLQEENLWTPEQKDGTYLQGNYKPENSFSSASNVAGGYLMSELPVLARLKAIFGARVENAQMFYTGVDQRGNALVNESTLSNLNVLPAMNLMYSVHEKMNLRASYSKTLARPSFKEKSNAQIYDPISDITFIGNLDLVQTDITNYDFRWESFFEQGQMISVSGFYKNFVNPIEIVAAPTAIDNFFPNNVGSSVVYGAEVEMRKNLGFVSEKLASFTMGGNVSIIESKVDMKQSFIPSEYVDPSEPDVMEYELRQEFARDGEVIDQYRSMYGQAPYLINGFMSFSNQEKGVEANLSYNVQGKTLSVVGSGRGPDVFTLPFHSLNFKTSYRFGKERKPYTVSLSAQNLLDAKKHLVYESYGDVQSNYQLFAPGRSFSVGFSYAIK